MQIPFRLVALLTALATLASVRGSAVPAGAGTAAAVASESDAQTAPAPAPTPAAAPGTTAPPAAPPGATPPPAAAPEPATPSAASAPAPARPALPPGTGRFVSPHPGEIVAGPTTLEVELGSPAPGTRVDFFVDGKPAGTAGAPPFQASFDFGDSLTARRLRAVVTSPAGSSFTLDLTTRAMGRADDTSRVDLVNLYVTVRDSSDKFVQGLQQASFRILENGKPQTISHFSAERQRLVVGIVLDTSLSMKGERIEQAREAARSFLEKLEPGDSAMGLCFNEDARLVHEETTDHAAVTLSLLACQPEGGTALYDAIYRAADRLAPVDGRKVVLLLSDGRDEAANGLDPGSLHTLEEALDRTLRSEVIVYVVGVGEHLDREMDFYGRRSLTSILGELAEKTGGRAVFIHRAGQLRNAFEDIGEELRHQYGIGYTSSDPRRDGTWRDIRATVDKPGAKATTRSGYFAPK